MIKVIAPEIASRPTLSVATLVNKDDLYRVMRASLAEQLPAHEIQWLPVNADARSLNAAQGLNDAINRATGRWIICVHQDVVFPDGWWRLAEHHLNAWPAPIGVAGLVGVTRGGGIRGHVLDPHGHCLWKPLPARVASLDEHLLILPGDTALRFDESNPGFHCYATDIAFTARSVGLDSIVIDAPVVHLSGGKLDDAFYRSAAWLLKKWGAASAGVIPTCCGVLSRRRPDTLLREARTRLAMRASRATPKPPAGTLTGPDAAYRAAQRARA